MELALDVGGELGGLGPLGVELLGVAGLVDKALGEAGAGAVEALLGQGDPVDQGEVGVDNGALQGQPGQGVGGSSALTRLARNQPGPAM